MRVINQQFQPLTSKVKLFILSFKVILGTHLVIADSIVIKGLSLAAVIVR